MKRINLPLLAAIALTCNVSHAELVALSDNALSQESGAGVALVLEDFVFDVNDAVTTVTGIESSDQSQELEIQWTELYIMGEGSENGTIKTPGQIGNLMHPWLVQSVRGDGIPDFLPPDQTAYDPSLPYAGIDTDIALLEIATDHYDNPVESTPTWGLFSVYQGCVWGQPGCDDSTDAVDGINAELDTLNTEETQLNDKYTSPTDPNDYAFANMSDVEASIQYNLDNQVADKQVEIDEQEVYVDEAWSGTNGVVDRHGQLPLETQQDTPIGQYADCTGFLGFCTTAETNYNNSLDNYYEEYATYSELKSQLAEIYTNPDLPTDLDGDGDLDGASGVALAVRMEDIDRYKTLCGVELSDTSCSDGLIVTREGQKGEIEKVSIALSNGVQRRGGLDIGSKFTFKFKDAATGNTERTDYIDIDMKGVYVDGSYFRIWAREDENGQSELNANISFNLYAKEINIATCGVLCEAPGMEQAMADSTLYLDNFLLNLNLGYGEVQPVKLSATSDGNFVLELVAPQYQDLPGGGTNAQQVYKDFYDNADKSYVFIGNIQLGTDPTKNLGSLTVDGLRASYLKVTSHDL